MKLPIQLISTDFDGTLHCDAECPPIPDQLQERIAELQSQGVKWVINTGRDMASLFETMESCGLKIRPDYLVVVEREIHRQEDGRYVGLDPWNRNCSNDHEHIFSRVRADLPRLSSWIQQRFKATIYEDAYSPFCLIAETDGDADSILQYMDEYCRQVPNLTIMRNSIYARFSHVAYHKGTALAEIARQLGIDRQHVFAAGDHFNDLPMLSTEYARWLVAPLNAIDVVKEQVKQQQGFLSPYPFGRGVAAGLDFCLSAAGAAML